MLLLVGESCQPSSAHQQAAGCRTVRDCTLSGECVDGRCVCDKGWAGDRCSQLKLKPAKLAAPFQPPRSVDKERQHFTWGAAPFQANDGRTCFYFTWLLSWPDGNHTKPVPWSDTVSGSLGLACSDSMSGPYEIIDDVAFPFRRDNYDACYLENCVMTYSTKHGGYLMAYTTAPGSEIRNTLNWEGNGGPPTAKSVMGLEYMGLAFSTDPLNAPWTRLNRTILQPKPDGFEGGVANNPAILWFDNGTVAVAYRGQRDDGFGNCVAPDWRAPCIRPPRNLFNSDPRWVGTEDAFTYAGPRGFIMIAHTFSKHNCSGGGLKCGAGVKAVSEDGLHWEFATDDACVASRCHLTRCRQSTKALLYPLYLARQAEHASIQTRTLIPNCSTCTD